MRKKDYEVLLRSSLEQCKMKNVKKTLSFFAEYPTSCHGRLSSVYLVAPHQDPIFATWAERMAVIFCNATPIDFYVASLERPRKNFLVRSLSLNISSPACVWLLGGSVACSGEVGQGPVN